MKTAMILAAGLGQRMGELTQDVPKPLLKLKGFALIEYLLWALSRAGITQVVINVHYHAQKIVRFIGDGRAYGLQVQYSIEEDHLLGTGGGVMKALPLLQGEPFVLVSGDIFTNFDFSQLSALDDGVLGHLVLVNNPEYKSEGDFSISGGRVGVDGLRFTYANIGVFSPELFSSVEPGCFPLAPVLYSASQSQQITGEFFNGLWFNVGTPQILESLNAFDAIPQLGGCPSGSK
jgi:N-acetyl-alpha-D-muramate 1-phosphate uridylyltransferase